MCHVVVIANTLKKLLFQTIVIKQLRIVRPVFPGSVIHIVTNERLIITC